MLVRLIYNCKNKLNKLNNIENSNKFRSHVGLKKNNSY